MDQRVEREREFHNKRYSQDNTDKQVRPFYASGKRGMDAYKETVNGYIRGARALEYGCGNTGFTVRLADEAKEITAIDISDVVIDAGNKLVEDKGVSNVKFLAMNAEQMTFPDDSFDLVYGSGILHHLEYRSCYSEIARVLRPGGRAVFLEPLNHNPLINLYRKMTPAIRTPDEHPLTVTDIELGSEYFTSVESNFFNLITLAAIPFWKTPFFKNLLETLETSEKTLFKIAPITQKYAWMTVLTFTK